MMTNKLSALHILNTRPAHQANALSQLLCQHEATITKLPAIEIKPSLKDPEIKKISQINQYDLAIFVSANAAQAVRPYWKPTHTPILCIGPATAQAVKSFQAITATASPASSAGLLLLPQLAKIHNKKILIICGSHHKPDLRLSLQKRQAIVEILTSYQILTPKTPSQKLNSIKASTVNLIIATSIHGLKQIYAWYQPHKKWLFNKRIVVVSENMREHALYLGWGTDKILLSPEATNQSIVETLLQKA
jgi:uroporphyrinogen-III synthase